MRIILSAAGAVAIAMLAGGCADRWGAQIERAHAAAAAEFDSIAELGVKVGCHGPPDALLRRCQESDDMCRAIFYACPDVRNLLAVVQRVLANEPVYTMDFGRPAAPTLITAPPPATPAPDAELDPAAPP